MGHTSVPDAPPPPVPPKKLSESSLSALERQRRLRLKTQGMASTFKTGKLGLLTPPTTAPKSLLGG